MSIDHTDKHKYLRIFLGVTDGVMMLVFILTMFLLLADVKLYEMAEIIWCLMLWVSSVAFIFYGYRMVKIVAGATIMLEKGSTAYDKSMQVVRMAFVFVLIVFFCFNVCVCVCVCVC